METIKSKNNEIVKIIAKLHQKKFRNEYGFFLVEGYKMVQDCIECNFEIDLIVVSKSKADNYKDFLSIGKSIILNDDIFEYVSDTVSPQGIMAVVKLKYFTLGLPQGNALILDRISDSGNLGTIIRTAAAADFNDIYLINCTDPYSPKTVRSSMSGIFFVRLYNIDYDFISNITQYSQIIGADMGGESYYSYVSNTQKIALAIGSESFGLSKFIKEKCNKILSIPMNNIESLNAAVSAGILMYHLKR